MAASLTRGTLIAMAACTLTACTTLSPATQVPSPLVRWLEEMATPAIVAWRDSAGPGAGVSVVPLGTPSTASPPSRLTLEVAEQLRRDLLARGVNTELVAAADPTQITETGCHPTTALPLRITITIEPAATVLGGSTEALVTVGVAESVGRPSVSLVSTRLGLDVREHSLAVERDAIVLSRGSLAQPYRAEELDVALSVFASQLRCDLLRVQVRAGAPQLVWDVDSPSSWYASFGRRLRDELVRLDGILGAPGSPLTLHRIEMGAEPSGVDGVLRLVARATSTTDADHPPTVVWRQAYIRAPGPTSRPPALALAPPPQPQPPAAPRPVALPPATSPDVRVALGDIRIHSPRGRTGCVADDPWRHGSLLRADNGPFVTGDCVALEVSGVRADELYLLHRDVTGPVTRLAPSTCVPASVQPGRERTFRVPSTIPGAPAIQLTPPSGSEHFYAIAVDRGADASLWAFLRSLPDTCGGPHFGPVIAADLLTRLEAEASRGHAAWRTLVLQHAER